jgi:hypothetical protein
MSVANERISHVSNRACRHTARTASGTSIVSPIRATVYLSRGRPCYNVIQIVRPESAPGLPATKSKYYPCIGHGHAKLCILSAGVYCHSARSGSDFRSWISRGWRSCLHRSVRCEIIQRPRGMNTDEAQLCS